MNYLYDGTLEGFLTGIYHHYYFQKVTGIYAEETYSPTFMEESKVIATHMPYAEKVIQGLKTKISGYAYRHVLYTFYSDAENKDDLLFRYILFCFHVGKDADRYNTHPCVLPVHKLSRRVSFEAHKFLGLLRFSDFQGILYAAFAPDHNILLFVAPHFADRMPKERLIIHDTGRDLAAFSNYGEWVITEFKLPQDPVKSEQEKAVENLWKTYFSHMTIENRKNPKLQRQFVPLRYRKHILEFHEESEK